MEPRIVKVGKYFINLNNLLWAEASVSSKYPSKKWVDLTYGDVRLHIEDHDAGELIDFLALNSQVVTAE